MRARRFFFLILLLALLVGAVAVGRLTAPYWIGIEVRSVVVEMTSTPDHAATQVAIGQSTAQAILEKAALAATEAAAEADRSQAEEVLETAVALVTQMAQQPTTAPVTPTPNQTQPGTLQAASPTPTLGFTATPTDTVKTYRFAVVNDDSSVQVRDAMVELLEDEYPSADAVPFDGCDHQLASQQWDLVVMDNTMVNSIDGPACIEAILLVHPDTKIIGTSLGRWMQQLTDAGALAVCETGDYKCLLEEVKKVLN